MSRLAARFHRIAAKDSDLHRCAWRARPCGRRTCQRRTGTSYFFVVWPAGWSCQNCRIGCPVQMPAAQPRTASLGVPCSPLPYGGPLPGTESRQPLYPMAAKRPYTPTCVAMTRQGCWRGCSASQCRRSAACALACRDAAAVRVRRRAIKAGLRPCQYTQIHPLSRRAGLGPLRYGLIVAFLLQEATVSPVCMYSCSERGLVQAKIPAAAGVAAAPMPKAGSRLWSGRSASCPSCPAAAECVAPRPTVGCWPYFSWFDFARSHCALPRPVPRHSVLKHHTDPLSVQILRCI